MRQKISAHSDVGPSGGSSVRRPGSEDPHRHEWNFVHFLIFHTSLVNLVNLVDVVVVFGRIYVIELEIANLS